MTDIRWIQRLNNFQQALSQLAQAVSLSKSKELSDLEKQGLIKAFEFTHELAWNVMKDYFEYQGTTSIRGSRDAAREAFQKDLIQNGEAWMAMINSRNLTSHTYNKEVAEEIIEDVIQHYFPEFKIFSEKMTGIAEDGQ